jgi:hypothetical protein
MFSPARQAVLQDVSFQVAEEKDVPAVRLSLSCAWSTQDKDDEPWYLLSDLPAGRAILAQYVGRFSIEEMFRDFKEQGFRLEKTRLRDTERVSRMVQNLRVCQLIDKAKHIVAY